MKKGEINAKNRRYRMTGRYIYDLTIYKISKQEVEK